MTAEQLKELLEKGRDPDCDHCGRDDSLLHRLARRVLAAEKLIEKLDDVIESRHIIYLVSAEDIAELDTLAAAYREDIK